MHLVLNGLEKVDADVKGRIIVHAGGVNIGDLPVKPLFRGADVLNSEEQFVKIVKGQVRVFQTFIVQDKALDNEFPDMPDGPLPEARGHMGLYPIAHRDNGVEIVRFPGSLDLPPAFVLNY